MVNPTVAASRLRCVLGDRELTDVGVALPEQVRTAGQVLQVAVVDLLRLNRDRLGLLGAQCAGPQIRCLGVVQLQGLHLGHVEARFPGVLLDHRDRGQPTTGEDLGEDELREDVIETAVDETNVDETAAAADQTAADDTNVDPVTEDADAAPADVADEAAEPPNRARGGRRQEDPAVALKKELRLKPGEWYVIHSYAGYENKVKANLETRVQNLDVGDYIFQVEVPTEEVTEIRTASASRSTARCCRATSWSAWSSTTSRGARCATRRASPASSAPRVVVSIRSDGELRLDEKVIRDASPAKLWSAVPP